MKKKEEKKITAKERIVKCKLEIERSLRENNCAIVARPSFRLRDDGTWSLVTTVEIVAN